MYEIKPTANELTTATIKNMRLAVLNYHELTLADSEELLPLLADLLNRIRSTNMYLLPYGDEVEKLVEWFKENVEVWELLMDMWAYVYLEAIPSTNNTQHVSEWLVSVCDHLAEATVTMVNLDEGGVDLGPLFPVTARTFETSESVAKRITDNKWIVLIFLIQGVYDGEGEPVSYPR